MKFTVTMKTPDALDEAIKEIEDTERSCFDGELSENDEEAIYDVLNEARNFASKFMRFGEYLTVEFDTKTKTATVIPGGK